MNHLLISLNPFLSLSLFLLFSASNPSNLSVFPLQETMILSAPAFSLSITQGASLSPFRSSSSVSPSSLNSSSSFLSTPQRKGGDGFVVYAAKDTVSRSLTTGVVFEPFEEMKKVPLSSLVPVAPHQSLARHKYVDDCEAAINEQINVEYNVSYVYHALYAYFDRDNVALKGLAKFFQESSDEERQHAEKFMEYQNLRGGRVVLQPIVSPQSEFYHEEKGDALYAMELSLALEKLTNEKLLKLHSVAERTHDVQMAEFVEREFLTEQVEAIKKISEYVAQLRRVGKGHGVWHFDQMLLHEDNGAA
ncbi:ferritin-3, chloroplastic-like [Macadamia integrifolia]|uniref:ferritin-3, chloroplastic-like n=1 Tax=Macadamia integrifolia TaxID=60698 RepID=UPI001C53274B|nr:ferritin-3, chloroplastic-like [Macadamia integrifolia]